MIELNKYSHGIKTVGLVGREPTLPCGSLAHKTHLIGNCVNSQWPWVVAIIRNKLANRFLEARWNIPVQLVLGALRGLMATGL